MSQRWNVAAVLLWPLCIALSTSLAAQEPALSPATDEAKEPPPAPPPVTAERIMVVPDHFQSPQDTMMTFLGALSRVKDDDTAWEEVIACLDLSKVDKDRANLLAAQLLDVLNRLGTVQPWQLDGVDDLKSDPITSFTYFPHERFEHIIGNRKVGGRIELAIVPAGEHKGYWKFSADTVAGIDRLNRDTEDLVQIAGEFSGSELSTALRLRRLVPVSFKQGSVLTLEYWQWMGLLVVILLGMTLDQTLRFLLRAMTNQIVLRQGVQVQAKIVTSVVRPIGLLSGGLLWLGLLGLLGLPDQAYTILFAAVRVFVMLAGVWAAWRLTDLIGEVLTTKAARTATKFDDVLIPLLRRTAKVFILVLGVIYTANSMHIDIVPLLTGLGIGGLAFAFAAKDTIENLFGSIAVVLDRPFEIGDWVVIGDVEGTVEAVGFRSSRIRTFYNSQVTIPNSNLVKANVDNYGRRKYRRWKTYVGVQYDTTPDQLIAFAEGIRELVRCHPFTRKDYFQVRVHRFGSSSIDILLYVFHEVPDWSVELRERERLMVDIVRLADRLGVQFAFPTQTVHLYQEQHQEHQVRHKVPDPSTDHRAEITGIRTAQQLVKDQPWQREKPGLVPYSAGPTHLDDDDPVGDR